MSDQDQTGASPAPQPERTTTQHWAVTVERNGEQVVTIETGWLSGRDLLPEDEAVIEIAANNLLGFIGKAASPAPPQEPHQRYGPCDGLGPGFECSECAKARFATKDEWMRWLQSDNPPAQEPLRDELRRIAAWIRTPGNITDAITECARVLEGRADALTPIQAVASGVEDMRARKDAAYAERNALVAALSKLWPSHLAQHPADDADWERDWMTIVCIHSPMGQLTWHVHDSQRELFAHLAEGEGHWDGHTTEQKYQRLAALSSPPQEPPRLCAVCGFDPVNGAPDPPDGGDAEADFWANGSQARGWDPVAGRDPIRRTTEAQEPPSPSLDVPERCAFCKKRSAPGVVSDDFATVICFKCVDLFAYKRNRALPSASPVTPPAEKS